MNHKHSEEDVEIQITDYEESENLHHVKARVEHEDYGSTIVAYGFPKGQGWHEKQRGIERFLLKLKDMALEELKPEQQFLEEKHAFKEKKFKNERV